MRVLAPLVGSALLGCHSLHRVELDDRAQCWDLSYGASGQVWRHPRAVALEPGSDSGRAQGLDGWDAGSHDVRPPGMWHRRGDSLTVEWPGGTRSLRLVLHVSDSTAAGLAFLTTDLGGAPEPTTVVGSKRACRDLARATS
jgi:hypothetical protein